MTKKSPAPSLKIGAAYIRVSTDGQLDLSPESQLDAILTYAKANNIVIPRENIFQESEGRSGKRAENRPEFQRMIATAKSKPKPFDLILVWKFSRFARNQDESTFYKGMLRKKLDIDVISISEPVLDGMYGRLIEMIIEWQDEFYSYNLAQDVYRGMRTKAQNGSYQCRPPLGYKIPYHRAVPEIIPEEADVVRMIFQKYVNEHMSIFAITKHLNALGIKTNRGKPFEKRSVEYILQNPAYAGIVRWNCVKNDTKQKKDKSEWIITQGTHPAIITEEMYKKAEERYLTEYRPKNAKPSEKCQHWLGGILKCSSCGRTLSSCIRHLKSGQDTFSFQCYGYLKGKCRDSHYVPEKNIVPVILDALRGVLESGDVDYEIKRDEKSEEHFELEALEARMNKLDMKEMRAKEAYMDGIDTKEEYKLNRELLRHEREQLEKLLSDLRQKESSACPEDRTGRMLDRIHTVLDVLESDQYTMIQKNSAIKSIIEKIVFHRENLHIDLYFYLTESPESLVK